MDYPSTQNTLPYYVSPRYEQRAYRRRMQGKLSCGILSLQTRRQKELVWEAES